MEQRFIFEKIIGVLMIKGSPVHNLANMLEIRNVSLIDTSLLVSHFISPTKEWDLPKLRQHVDDDLLKLILATPIPFSPIPDSVCWGLSGNGDLVNTTKSATWAAHDIDLVNTPSWEFHWIWHLDIMPKLKVFLWQLCHASLPTRGTLLRRGLQIDPLCPLCNNDIEDLEHLFLKCPVVHDVWHLAKVHKWLSIPLRVAPDDNLQSWLAKLRISPSPVPLDRVVALWSI